MQIYTHLQAEDTRAAIAKLSLPARELGNNLALVADAQQLATDATRASPPKTEGCDGGPHWTRTSNFHAVNMAL
jgi:hypothetical protein